MAQTVLRNTRDHDITLAIATKGEVKSITIPASRPHETEANKKVHGEVQADAELVKVGIKQYPVIKHYFDEGWLVFAMELTAAEAE